MTNEPDLDQALRRDFQRLRADDALRTPDFTAMLARARVEAAAAPVVSPPVAPSVTTWRRAGTRVLLVGAPLAAAAALALWFRPTNAADQEFEQAVAAYSQTAARTSTSPTDGLLAVPGTEFLRGTPIDGMVMRTPRRGS